MLTKRQKQILNYLKRYIKENDYSPSLEEIARHFRLSSVSGIHQHIETLKGKGYLKKIENQPRSIELNKKRGNLNLVTIPLLGIIAAGEPIEAIEDKETIEVPKSQLSKSGEHFALRVSGDSMIDEGIFDGDTVIIRKQPDAENGETVVALINGDEVTLKKIYKEKNGFRLQPANPNIKPIFTKELTVQGKVVSVIRSFEELKKTASERNIKIEEKTKSPKNILKKWLNTIQCIDCVKGIKQLPDESINLIIADPPYGISRELNCKNQRLGTTAKLNFNFGEWDKFDKEWFEIALKKTQGWIISFCAKKNLGIFWEILEKNGFVAVDALVWQKPDPVPLNAKSKFLNAWETAIVGKKPGACWNGHYEHNVFNEYNIFKYQAPKGKNRIHPTQKPLDLIKRLIKLTTKEDDIVLDPFIGSGTTAVACKELNRNYIGFEISEKYCKRARERIKETNIPLFTS